MQTITQNETGTRTATGTLEALNFKTEMLPVYDQEGREIPGYLRVYRQDTKSTLAVMSDKYKLVEHHEVMFPAVKALGQDGWAVKASRIERGGASAYVELVRKDVAHEWWAKRWESVS